MRNLIALLLLTTSINAAPRVLSAERLIGDATPVNNSRVTGPIDVASSPDSIVAAWSDSRGGSRVDIFATRLDDDGVALDPYGIQIGNARIDKQLLRVAWDGRRYLFFWSGDGKVWVSTMDHQEQQLLSDADRTTIDYVPGLLLSNRDGRVAISTIDDRLALTSTHVIDEHGYGAHLVRNGNATLAVWIHDFGSAELMAQRVDRGVASGMPLQLGTVSGIDVQIATAPSLLAYADRRTVHVLDMQPNGALTPHVTYDAAGIESIASTSDGGFIAVANRQLRRYDAAGTLVDSVSIDSFFKPRLTSGHGNVLAVAITQGPVSYVWRAPQTRNISSIAPVQTLPRLASDGTNALLLWNEELPENHLFAQLISAYGQPLRDRLELPALLPGEVPAVGFDGRTYVVIRTTPRTGHYEITGQRIARDGSLDGAVFLVAESQAKIRDTIIAGDTVAWIDEGFTLPHMRWTTLGGGTPLLWNPATDITAASNGSDVLIAASTPTCGVAIAAPLALPIMITTDCADDGLAIAGNGNRWLVVYGDGAGISGRFLQRDGSSIGEPITILASSDGRAPRVAWDGDQFVVTFEWGPFLAIAKVSEDGHVEHHQPSSGFGPQQNGDLVAFANGTTLLAYTRVDLKTLSSRVVTRTLSRARVRPVR
jgi:hypothetical protein